MDFKNLISRFVFSIILFLVYLISIQNIYFLFFLALFIYLIIFYEVIKYFKNLFYLISIYLIFSFINFLIYTYYFYDLFLFNLFIFIIISFDTFSYLAGSLFGKKIIFKIISPKKTFEGLIGGIISTNLLFFLYLFFIVKNNEFLNYFIFINLIIISSFFGDLFQSFLKRRNKIKDSSNFLPGHGGFFDRFDSFVFSVILLSIYGYIIS